MKSWLLPLLPAGRRWWWVVPGRRPLLQLPWQKGLLPAQVQHAVRPSALPVSHSSRLLKRDPVLGHMWKELKQKLFCGFDYTSDWQGSWREPLNWKHATGDDLICVVMSHSPACEEGTFDCDAAIQSVTVLGVKNKPSAVLVHLAGEELCLYSPT